MASLRMTRVFRASLSVMATASERTVAQASRMVTGRPRGSLAELRERTTPAEAEKIQRGQLSPGSESKRNAAPTIDASTLAIQIVRVVFSGCGCMVEYFTLQSKPAQ